MNTETQKLYAEFIASVKLELKRGSPMLSFIVHKRLFGYWGLDDSDILQSVLGAEETKLQKSIYLLLILESEEIGAL